MVWSGLASRPLEPQSSHIGLWVRHGSHRYALGLIMDTRVGRHEPLVLAGWHEIVRNREVVSVTAQSRQRYWD